MPSHMIILVLNNDNMLKMKNDSVSGLDLPERPLWSMLPLEGHVGVCGLLPQTMLKPKVHVDIYLWPYSRQGSYTCL